MVEIILDGAAAGAIPSYEPGATLTGHVRFTPDPGVTVGAVYVRVDWSPRGKGNTSRGPRKQEKLPMPEGGQAVEAGQTVEWPFSCRLPESPWSYAGQLISIVWEVTATVQVSWELDPDGVCEFTLRPSVK